jgi:hypothetical protein
MGSFLILIIVPPKMSTPIKNHNKKVLANYRIKRGEDDEIQ